MHGDRRKVTGPCPAQKQGRKAKSASAQAKPTALSRRRESVPVKTPRRYRTIPTSISGSVSEKLPVTIWNCQNGRSCSFTSTRSKKP